MHCPWVSGYVKFLVGSESMACCGLVGTHRKPCHCRHTELEGGHEKIIGRFETESDKANLGHEPQLIHV